MTSITRPELTGNDMRDIITHLATYYSPSVGQRHVDYIFQYRWEEAMTSGLSSIVGSLRDLEAVFNSGGDDGVRSMLVGGGRDKLRDGVGKLEPLRYWKLGRQESG